MIQQNCCGTPQTTALQQTPLKRKSFTFQLKKVCSLMLYKSFNFLMRTLFYTTIAILCFLGKETQAKQWCPSPLLARFTYKHVTANGTETCTGVSSLDVCTNRTTMTFDYTKCSTTQAFSSQFEISDFSAGQFYLISLNYWLFLIFYF